MLFVTLLDSDLKATRTFLKLIFRQRESDHVQTRQDVQKELAAALGYKINRNFVFICINVTSAETLCLFNRACLKYWPEGNFHE